MKYKVMVIRVDAEVKSVHTATLKTAKKIIQVAIDIALPGELIRSDKALYCPATGAVMAIMRVTDESLVRIA